MLKGKKILLGITGSIAAYKAILLVRLFVKEGAEVKVIMTPAARDFVSALTLSTLSKNKVLVNIADEDTWANHVMLGRWADVMLIAPLSCNTLSKMAIGACDNLLMAAYLSATCPVVVAPAMDEDMWKHPAIQNNISSLQTNAVQVISVGKGDLASGLVGEGRMAEPEQIVTFLIDKFFRSNLLAGYNAMVTAGPTYEAIDPVRFIGNHSSGAMGFAIATQLYLMGASVHLVTGPTSLSLAFKAITRTNVLSANEMFEACINNFGDVDIAVMSAAVADYSPAAIATQKIKKAEEAFSLFLTKTKDILKHLGTLKSDRQVLVGFALETENERQNAIGKLTAKNADMIVLNSMNDVEAGFGKPTNKVTIFDKEGLDYTFEAKSKTLVANDIINLIIKRIHDKA